MPPVDKAQSLPQTVVEANIKTSNIQDHHTVNKVLYIGKKDCLTVLDPQVPRGLFLYNLESWERFGVQ